MNQLTSVCLALTLLALQTPSVRADAPVILTKDKTTVVDLTGTDLLKEKNLLDCQLRLVGKPPNYRLIYSLGEIEVPPLAVKVDYDHRAFLLGVSAQLSGMPVDTILVSYRESAADVYRLQLSGCNSGEACWGSVAYTVHVQRPETVVQSRLLSRYGKELVLDKQRWQDVDSGALVVRDRPGIVPASSEGQAGDKSKKNTVVHYVCATE